MSPPRTSEGWARRRSSPSRSSTFAGLSVLMHARETTEADAELIKAADAIALKVVGAVFGVSAVPNHPMRPPTGAPQAASPPLALGAPSVARKDSPATRAPPRGDCPRSSPIDLDWSRIDIALAAIGGAALVVATVLGVVSQGASVRRQECGDFIRQSRLEPGSMGPRLERMFSSAWVVQSPRQGLIVGGVPMRLRRPRIAGALPSAQRLLLLLTILTGCRCYTAAGSHVVRPFNAPAGSSAT